MIRVTMPVLIPALLFVAACSIDSSAPPAASYDGVRFALVVFDGASSETIRQGNITRNEYETWFMQDYAVGGERIETPKSADSIGALFLVDGNKVLTMPLCSWRIASGHSYFACQSDAIGNAPMFSICTESKTKAEFLDQIDRKIKSFSANGG